MKGAPNPLEIAFDENGKMKTKPAPVYIFRRILTIAWQGKSLALVERENRTVEVIEGDKAPESDDVIGRIVPEGATLILHADGKYEFKDAPAKSDASPSQGVDQPAAAPAVVSPPESGAASAKP
ncbi:MAG TPA: hypothetical protein VHO24_09080 [Opitutaceae bacterium]|nr:hypothetical protein [Opitutaceae bacterium]